MRWTEERLRTRFPAKVREERQAEGLNPDVRPTQDWLREHGYSGIEGFARRNDMTTVEVLEDICGFDPRPKKPLNIRHAETRRLVKKWLEAEENFYKKWGETRIDDARTHFRTLAKIALEETGTTNLLRILQADSETERKLLRQLFSELSSRMENEGSEANYTRSLERWGNYLIHIDEIEEHKITSMREMIGYTYERESPEYVLEPEQIRECWRATEDLEEKMLLLILIASGIRRAESTNIEISDLRLDRDDPYIVFDEDRKTDAATVPIMAGVELIELWIEHLEELDHWDGKWLFPSKKSRDGSRSASWVNNTIKRIVKRADVAFPDGKEPTPKHFRDFWYNHYIDAQQTWLSHVEMLADEQGVSSSKIIDLHYLTGKRSRDHFRKFAQSYFDAVFGEELVHGIEAIKERRAEERDSYLQAAITDYMDELRAELTTDNGTPPDDENDDEPVHKSPAGDPVSVWTRARLRVEHASAAASDKLEHYPPSPTRTAALITGYGVWAVLFGTFWRLTGVFTLNPISGNVTATPGAIIGIALGVLFIIATLPNLDRVTPDPPQL